MPQQTIARIRILNQELAELMNEFKNTLARDEIFEVRKAILLKIKEIEKQIDALNKISDPAYYN